MSSVCNLELDKGVGMNKVTAVLIMICLSIGILAEAAAPKSAPEPPRDLAIEMGAPFHDNMILQREMDVPIWGWSKPGAEVTVEFAGQKVSAKAGADGKWMLKLKPLKASAEEREMLITDSSGKKEILKGVLVGEVWMCSGQSNMQWLSSSCIVGRKLQPEILARIEAGEEKKPIIREVKVTNKFSSLYPSYRVKAKWSEEWGGMSAVAFAFIYEVAKEMQVPVGIVNCAFSTTQIQAWVPREGFAAGQDEYTKAIYQKILESDHATPEHKAAWAQFEKDVLEWGIESKARVAEGKAALDRPKVPGNMSGNRDATWMCNGKITPMAPYAIRGAIWNQGYASQNEGLVYRNNLHSLVRGWRAIWNDPELPVYFHQFYSLKGGDGLTLSSGAEMRLGTWLAHMDIPNAAMASQIDIVGGVHYYNKAVPGQRLALHALKNEYGKKVIANGPMYKGYKVKGDKLILELDHADGLCVGQSHTVKGGYADPVQIDDGEEQVKLFWLADKDYTWHKASVKIGRDEIILTADGLKEPRGVAYAYECTGARPGIYNKAMLPLTPFVVYDHKLVVSDQWDLDHIKIPGIQEPFEFMTWPLEYMPLADEEVDPKTYGLQGEYYKLWLLAPQFAHNCVIQAGSPVRVYGKAIPKSVVTLRFAGFEKSLTMADEQDEWEIALPAMKASAEPHLLHVTCTLDGKLAHERKISNVVVGDVWYVAATEFKVERGPGVPQSGPAPLEAWEGRNPQLRMLTSGGRRAEDMPQRFKMNASGNPISRFFTRWAPVTGLTQELAERIHAKTKGPVGVIVLDPGTVSPIKEWVGYEHLAKVKAWKSDYDQLYPRYAADPEAYVKNSEGYVKAWQEYWKSVKTDPGFETGAMAKFPGAVTVDTKATRIYNQSICGVSPGNFKGIICLTGKGFVMEDEGAGFAEQFAVMANCWKDSFAWGGEVEDPYFIYAMPSKALAPKISVPKGIRGDSSGFQINDWMKIESKRTKEGVETTLCDNVMKLIDHAVEEVY